MKLEEIKEFPNSYSTKEITNSSSHNYYNINTLNRKNVFKISQNDIYYTLNIKAKPLYN